MANPGEALAATIDAQWNVGTGGVKPSDIEYIVNTSDFEPNPLATDAIFVFLPLRGTKERFNSKLRNATYFPRVVCQTKTDTARLEQITNEVDRIVAAGTPITGATYQDVLEVNDISDRMRGGYPFWVSELNCKIFTQFEASATQYGTATVATLETDELTVNIFADITGLKIVDNDIKDSGGNIVFSFDGSGALDADITFTGERNIISDAALNFKTSGDIDDYWQIYTVSNIPVFRSYGGSDCIITADGNIRIMPDIDFDDYWEFTTSGNVATFQPADDKVHLIGSPVRSADNIYSDDFTNTSPFKKFDSPISELKKITHKDDKIDYESIPEWIRTVARDPAKQVIHRETRTNPSGEEEEYDVVDKRAPKDVVLNNAWSVNRMVILLYQALQEATARIETLEAR